MAYSLTLRALNRRARLTAFFGASTKYVRGPVRSASPAALSRLATTGQRLQRGSLLQQRFLTVTSRGFAIGLRI
jgi:hypothetical protein